MLMFVLETLLRHAVRTLNVYEGAVVVGHVEHAESARIDVAQEERPEPHAPVLMLLPGKL